MTLQELGPRGRPCDCCRWLCWARRLQGSRHPPGRRRGSPRPGRRGRMAERTGMGWRYGLKMDIYMDLCGFRMILIWTYVVLCGFWWWIYVDLDGFTDGFIWFHVDLIWNYMDLDGFVSWFLKVRKLNENEWNGWILMDSFCFNAVERLAKRNIREPLSWWCWCRNAGAHLAWTHGWTTVNQSAILYWTRSY